jgi:hypothetical protein
MTPAPQTEGAFGRGGDFFIMLSADGASGEFNPWHGLARF